MSTEFAAGSLATWTAQQAGTYRVVAWGARGGAGKLKQGGAGACIAATFTLAAGDVLDVCAGILRRRVCDGDPICVL